eukprot:1952436-Pleurochrysis_carterae.AAC.1
MAEHQDACSATWLYESTASAEHRNACKAFGCRGEKNKTKFSKNHARYSTLTRGRYSLRVGDVVAAAAATAASATASSSTQLEVVVSAKSTKV